jgi:hypothetical protein
MGQMRNAYIFSEDLKGRDYLENIGVDKKMILKCILKKQYMILWTGFM